MSNQIETQGEGSQPTIEAVRLHAPSPLSEQISALFSRAGDTLRQHGGRIAAVTVLAAGGLFLYRHPPFQTVERGEIGVRVNMLTGGSTVVGDGGVVVIPGLQQLRRFSLRDQLYHPADSASASGAAPFQSEEGLSLGVDLNIRYALDPAQIGRTSRVLPEDIGGDVVRPMVQGVIYKTFTRYTVREIYSTKRSEIQQSIETELKPKLAAEGIVLKSVQMGKVDLPPDYRNGMNQMLAEELETEKMRYTLELKDKQVKQNALEAEAEKVRREKAAEAAGEEQIIAAKAQEEAMKHVLPFKQKQIEQRQLEAEAEKIARVKQAEANAESRRIEAGGEADSRKKLADADVYREEQMGKAESARLERDGALLSKNPLLIQKTMADKLSDKVSVIIAPPSTSGGFIGNALLGINPSAKQQAPQDDNQQANAGGSEGGQQ